MSAKSVLSTVLGIAAFILLPPGLAFLVVFAGCSGPSPVLDAMCGHNIILTLVVVAIVFWFVLGAAMSFVSALKRVE